MKTEAEKKGAKVLARHKGWVSGATITETIVSRDPQIRRYTATIRGWQCWKLYEGAEWDAESIANMARHIRDRIDAGDETVFEKLPAKSTPPQ